MDHAALRQRLKLPPITLVAAAAGALVGLAFLVMPDSLLESIMLASGLPAIIGALEPPLDVTTRLVLCVLAGGGTAGVLWLGLSLLLGDGAAKAATDESLPVLRREDIHPDAPARRTSSAARDLGEPPARVQPLPDDLDQPIAAFDPAAIRAEPLEPMRALPSLARTFDDDERLAAFDLPPFQLDIGDADPLDNFTPPFRHPPRPVIKDEPMAIAPTRPVPVAPANDDVRALLARLERGVATRPAAAQPAPQPKESLQDALVALRKLAAR